MKCQWLKEFLLGWGNLTRQLFIKNVRVAQCGEFLKLEVKDCFCNLDFINIVSITLESWRLLFFRRIYEQPLFFLLLQWHFNSGRKILLPSTIFESLMKMYWVRKNSDKSMKNYISMCFFYSNEKSKIFKKINLTLNKKYF